MEKNKSNSTSVKNVKPVPEGFHTVTPFIIVNHADMLIEFIKAAFNGEVTSVMKGDDEKIMHATVRIGDSIIMLSDSSEQYGPMPCMLYLYVEDVDSVYHKALEAKGSSLREPVDEFYGDRSAGIKDPWDNQWWIASHVEDVSPDEMKKRSEEFRSHQAVTQK